MADNRLLAVRYEMMGDGSQPPGPCAPGCVHNNSVDCQSMREAIQEASGVQHQGSAMTIQIRWLNLHAHRMKYGVGRRNGLSDRRGAYDRITEQRNQVGGIVVWNLLRHVRDMSRRVSVGPQHFDCTMSEFKLIFSHVGSRTHGISFRLNRSGTRAVVTVTCMPWLLCLM